MSELHKPEQKLLPEKIMELVSRLPYPNCPNCREYFESGSYEKILRCLENTIEDIPENADLLLHLSEAFMLSDNPERAVWYFNCYLKYKPDCYDELIKAGDYCRSNYRFHFQAEHYYEQALKIDKKSMDALTGLASIRIKGWKSEAAFKLCKKLLRTHPEDYRLYHIIGDYYYLTIHNCKKGIEWYKKAYALNPEDVNALFSIAGALDEISRYEEAAEYLFLYLKSEPDSCSAFHSLANTLDCCGRHEEAIEYYKKACSLKPHYYGLYQYCIGMCYFHMGKYDEAEAVFRKRMEINESEDWGIGELTTILKKQGKTDEAISFLKQRIRKNPRELSSHRELGDLYSEMQQYEKALPHYVKYLSVVDNDAYLLCNVALIYYVLGNQEKAVRYLSKAIKIEDDCRSYARSDKVLKKILRLLPEKNRKKEKKHHNDSVPYKITLFKNMVKSSPST
ncbi:MAG: hypothetical protein LWY06_01615 [Firmicutes bacterium]|nr:hypothetical protein [Bacillota bacterium]